MNWGILSTGVIARNFAETAKHMDDVHIHAVASRSMESANTFADQYGIPVRYASALALAQDPNVDIVYIGTPHNAHYEGMKLMLSHGKHVLCEKSFTTDAGQAREIFDLAKEKGVFVMEAFWTKLCPVYREVERVIASGEIGEIRAVTAQYGYTTAREARKFDPSMAGGTLLDIGVYAVGFACMMLGYAFDEIKSSLIMNSAGTDAIDAITLRKGEAVAQLTTAIGANMPLFGGVYGTKGHIDIPDFKNPQRVTVCVDGKAPYELSRPFEVNGFEYEIREAMRCVREGKTHSDVITPEQSVAVMAIMDEIRRQNGFVFPFEA
ncbi:MAG: Gfo/Idh/MocA family oxidoreductase [Clostridia bacterium]|nr:Gfo/Idh/MocA family oxidoreductase [Clostridia bacterium]